MLDMALRKLFQSLMPLFSGPTSQNERQTDQGWTSLGAWTHLQPEVIVANHLLQRLEEKRKEGEKGMKKKKKKQQTSMAFVSVCQGPGGVWTDSQVC